MVGVFTIPVSKKRKELIPLAPGMDEVLKKELKPLVEVADGEELLPVVDPDVEGLPKHKEGEPGDVKEWEELIQPEEVEVQNCTMVDVLPDCKGQNLLAAAARMVARLNYLGLEVRRIHSDRAGELASKAQRLWAAQRGILRTYKWPSGGGGAIRRSVNVLLRSAGPKVTESQWPMIAKHIGERRGREQLAILGYVTPRLLPNMEVWR